jgi:choline kinase
MDADVLFPDSLLSELVFSPHPNALLLDPRSSSTGEEMMLMVKGNRVVHIGRKVEGTYDLIGEGVGFLKLSRKDAPVLKEALEQLIRAGKDGCEYEEAIEILLQKAVVGYEPVGNMAWTEIDFPEDIQKAETEVLPKL